MNLVTYNIEILFFALVSREEQIKGGKKHMQLIFYGYKRQPQPGADLCGGRGIHGHP